MERIVRMSETEYDRFCEFQGAEKTVRSMRTQMDMRDAGASPCGGNSAVR